MSMIELKVPDIGGSKDVNVAEIYVKVGDTVNKDDNIIMLETDKATMEVPAEHGGIVKEVLIQVGSKVNEGDLLLKIESAEDKGAAVDTQDSKKSPDNSSANSVESAKSSASSVESTANKIDTTVVKEVAVNNSVPIAAYTFDEIGFAKSFASPSIRKLARELGADLSRISGSAKKGRITEADVKNYVKSILTGGALQSGTVANGAGLDLLPWPKVDFTKFGEVEVKELSRIKKLSGSNLARNWVMIPHVTQFDEADITGLEDFRKQLNEEYKKSEIKITPLAFLIKACVYALKQFPEFNASLDGDKLVYKKYYNIGFAADTPNGLVVPVLKDADKKGVIEIARESSDLAKLARDGKLKPNDMQGGTFTISSLGGIGGTAFTPIINAPEVAILGVSKSGIKPVWDGKAFQPKLMLPLSLSYDHRIIDGALAAKFTTYLSKVLSDIRRLVI